MAKVTVTRDISIRATETATVHYEAGFADTAPRDHIDRIVGAGAGYKGVRDEPAVAGEDEAEAQA